MKCDSLVVFSERTGAIKKHYDLWIYDLWIEESFKRRGISIK